MNTHLKDVEFSQKEMTKYCSSLVHHYESLSSDDLYLRFNNVVSLDAVKARLHKFYIDPKYTHTFYALLNEKGEMIGVSQLAIDPETGLGEYTLSVVETYQRRGIGKTMLKRLLKIAKEKGCKKVEGYISYSNIPSKMLAESLGAKVAPEESMNLFLALFII